MKSEPDHSQEKALIRRRIRQARAALTPPERLKKDQAINESVLRWIRSNASSVVGAYIAFDGEPSLDVAMHALLDWDCVVVLPVIIDVAGEAHIEFRQWSAATELKPNRYGIPEPQGTPSVQASDLDPGVDPAGGLG